MAPPTRPLVSELSSTDASSELTNITAADKVESHDNKEAVAPKDVQQEDLVGVVQEVTKDWSSKQEWLTPPFSYRQDDNAVFFVLYTSGVKKSSMVSHFEEHEVSILIYVYLVFDRIWQHVNICYDDGLIMLGKRILNKLLRKFNSYQGVFDMVQVEVDRHCVKSWL